jgi:hypothetical protein
MFVTWEDFEDWREEQTLRELENEFTHNLDFVTWGREFVERTPEHCGQGTIAWRWFDDVPG